MKRIITIVLTLVLIPIMVAATGCGTKSTTTTTTPTTPTEPSYAGVITENILISINQDDYANFSKDLDQAMLQALPESGFQQLVSQLENKIGDYISKQFYTTVVQGDITTVVYIAKYTKQDNVTVTVSFQTVNGKNLVAGLHFPNLQ